MKKIKLGKRTAGLMLAVGLAAIATLSLLEYVHGLENKAYAGQSTVAVYVARQTIPVGTPANQAISGAAIERKFLPRTIVAQSAITSLDEIQGRIAAVTIQPGETILASRFVAPGDAATAGLDIPAGKQAMAVEVGAPPAVAGFVGPGAHVSVLAHLSATDGRESQQRVQFLLQDVPVLAVGQRTLSTPQKAPEDKTQQGSSERVVLTLAVTPAQAEQLGYAIFEGDVYFTLLGADGKASRTPGRTATTVFK